LFEVHTVVDGRNAAKFSQRTECENPNELRINLSDMVVLVSVEDLFDEVFAPDIADQRLRR